MNTKILIIKLGHSETLDPEIGRVPSLGDVLRTTPILWALMEKYPASDITWLVSKEAEPLLHKNKFINKVLVWDEFVPFQLMREKFDILINLEKIPGVCALSDMVDAWTKYGFRFDSVSGKYHAYERGLSFIKYLEDKQANKRAKDFWQKVLIEMLGVAWKEQEYILGYRPKAKEVYDVGLNYRIGSKWPTKVVPMDKWKELECKLSALGYRVSWQEGLNNLYEYMDWINSCKTIITQDSLGIHISLALKKNVIGLFGPTDPQEVYSYGKIRVIQPVQKCEYMPCYSPDCLIKSICMQDIPLDKIVSTVKCIKDARNG